MLPTRRRSDMTLDAPFPGLVPLLLASDTQGGPHLAFATLGLPFRAHSKCVHIEDARFPRRLPIIKILQNGSSAIAALNLSVLSCFESAHCLCKQF